MQFIRHHHNHNDRPFPCTICGKRFTQKAHLIIHKRTHTGERPYSCHICHKRFAQTSHLAVHKRVHTGEKPFFCNFCGMGFCRRPRLEAHILQHVVKDGALHQHQHHLPHHHHHHQQQQQHQHLQRSPPVSSSAEMMMVAAAAAAGIGRGGGSNNLNLSLNQESLDAAAQLIELKMKGAAMGGVGGGIAITGGGHGLVVGGGGGGPDPFLQSQSQIKAEPMESAEDRLRMRDGHNTNTHAHHAGGASMIGELASLNSKGVIDISGEDDPKNDEILKLKQWAVAATSSRTGGVDTTTVVAAHEVGKFTSSGLTELNSVQQQALNKSLVMPTPSNPNMLSPTQASAYHAAMAASGSPTLTMTGLVRTNSRVSLIDFTAEDILQHLLSRDDIKSCEFCCLVFKDPAMYYLHRSMHDKQDIRCCNLCGKLMKDKYDFTAHYLNQHK